MKILRTQNNNFYKDLKKIQKLRLLTNVKNVDRLVKKIISEIIDKGDKALFDFANKFDGSSINYLLKLDK